VTEDAPLGAQPERDTARERDEAERDAEHEAEHVQQLVGGRGERGIVGGGAADRDGDEAGGVAEQADGRDDVKGEDGATQ
jgi:hypothetical protein